MNQSFLAIDCWPFFVNVLLQILHKTRAGLAATGPRAVQRSEGHGILPRRHQWLVMAGYGWLVMETHLFLDRGVLWVSQFSRISRFSI